MKGTLATKTYLREIDGLGEFKFIFTNTPTKEIKEGTNKYFVEAIWNPKDYGDISFLVGYYISNIEKEIENYEKDFGMDYFIDGARISSECAVEDIDDIDGVYTGILINYFGYKNEKIYELNSKLNN